MTRSRKAAEAAGEPQQLGAAGDEPIENTQATTGTAAGEPSQLSADQSTEAVAPQAVPAEKRPFQVVRGWTSRNKPPVTYRKLTDADLGIILFKFVLPEGQNTLAPDIKDILDAHKRFPETGETTGLHFENSAKHGKIWAIKNTPEGRSIADKIDFALQKLAAKYELQEGQPAAGR